MKNIFMGSGDFALELFQLLAAREFEIEAVVTRPDKPAGRGLRQRPLPLKKDATARGLEVFQPENLLDEGNLTPITSINPDFILVVDYGLILPPKVLAIPGNGCVNVHPSLLPKYRGAAPIQRALMDGAEVTGVSLILMDEGMDTGPIIAQEEMSVDPEDDLGGLQARLAVLAAGMVGDKLALFATGELEVWPQGPGATYASPITKAELAIRWTNEAPAVHNQVRALSPSPGAFSPFRGKRIKILRSRVFIGNCEGRAGSIIDVDKEEFRVACGKGCLGVEVLQPEGRKAMAASEFIRGYRPAVGELFGGA
jgi:methionyl-tRNA formyltransferase